jgi:hypothetical protein
MGKIDKREEECWNRREKWNDGMFTNRQEQTWVLKKIAA